MNWTSREPIEGMKCIVETDTGCTFPAHHINGTWWNTERAFPIDGVRRWIAYPAGEEPNDCIPPEVLLKYVMKAYRKEHNLVESLRELNKELVTSYNKLKKQTAPMRTELEQKRKEVRKLKGLFNTFCKVFDRAKLMQAEEEDENQKED